MEDGMSTKDKILDAALTLFAENGYNGTSVEQIAKAVGIKAPSLYKHYKSKEDILNALVDSAEARYEEMFGSERNIGKIPESREEFIEMTMGRISFTCGIRSSGKRGCSWCRNNFGTKGPQRSLPGTSWTEFRGCMQRFSKA